MSWQPGLTIADVERQAIEAAMKFFRHNKTQTAKALDISIRTLDAKLAKYEERAKSIADQQAESKRQHEEFIQKNYITTGATVRR